MTQNNNIPKHVAIIMDGNGRWAKSRKLQRSQGHIEGVKRVEEIIDAANNAGVGVLTLFTFSTENWGRPKSEVSLLMKILSQILGQKTKKLIKENIRFNLIGRREDAPEDVLKIIEETMAKTKKSTGMVLNMAFNYGGRVEIVEAAKKIASDVKTGKLKIDDISEKTISQSLYTKGLPDPDLLIRTSGEQRISNFLLWQLSYAEFYFTEKFWPDFTEKEFKKAIKEYQRRDRRYGEVLHSHPKR